MLIIRNERPTSVSRFCELRKLRKRERSVLRVNHAQFEEHASPIDDALFTDVALSFPLHLATCSVAKCKGNLHEVIDAG